MKPILILCLAVLLAFPAQAARRVGEAQVGTDANDRPCFTISEREEKRGTPNFQAITVTDNGRVLWHMAMPRERTFPVHAGMCVPYGGRVAALPQTPSAALQEGRLYSVQIEARPARSAALPARYQAQFCLVRKGSGQARVHDVGAARQAGRRTDACLPGG